MGLDGPRWPSTSACTSRGGSLRGFPWKLVIMIKNGDVVEKKSNDENKNTDLNGTNNTKIFAAWDLGAEAPP